MMTDVIGTMKGSDWKVLILDQLSTRMISACSKMTEIMSAGITLVEDINKRREPLPQLDAIYLITPTEKSIRSMVNDFVDSNQLYKCAHIFFTEACPDELFNQLCNSEMAKRNLIKTCKEVNIAFLPYEGQVFSLDAPDIFELYYSGNKSQARTIVFERIAEQIATLCSCLGEYPGVRYRQEFDRNGEFAQLVQQKLDAYKADDPSMGQGPQKDRSQLIILDRGFDPISMFVHELSFQAMAYDLLPIDNDVYKYESQSPSGESHEREVILDENDDMWMELRHQHIATVSQAVTKKLKDFSQQKRFQQGSKALMRDVAQMIKKMPQYQKELNKYATHFHLAEDCMKQFKNIEEIIKMEQDLATGFDSNGDRIQVHKEPPRPMIMQIMNPNVIQNDKIRLIMLYIILRGGMNEENLRKLFEHAKLPTEDINTIKCLQNLNLTVIQEGNRRTVKQHYQAVNRRERTHEQRFQMSRWVPYVKDIMEEAIEDKLDQRRFPFLSSGPRSMMGGSAPISARYGNWHNKAQTPKSGPRLIIFIVGGVMMNEMRCAYEVTNYTGRNRSNWEVIIGSTHIATPAMMLDHLRNLWSSSNAGVCTP
ncbi:DgyrCDS10071 [Dimorphilus gyrociliatus]|uniref:DgyrCDS10071 n=1 Tax=Dimorphilus gyrociliatus TaxID=2664684 RepID=A0A7I8W0I8_9ANNE|nr:DgyrCDS10071 [Dimorphilus gyrociliatus]